MIDLVARWLTQHPFFLPLLIVVGSLVALAMAWHLQRVALRELARARDELRDLGAEPGPSKLRVFVRRFVVPLPSESLPETVQRKTLLTESIEHVLDEYAAHATSSALFGLGSLATGFALICTFLLIGWVLQTDIGTAVRGASETSNSDALASGVQALGAKFYISASGIASSVVFALFIPVWRRTVFERAHGVARALAPDFATPATLAAATQLAMLSELRTSQQALAEHDARRTAESREVTAPLAELNSQVAFLRGELGNLRSIEVSVQGIGTNLKTELSSMLKNDLGNELRDMIGELKVYADELATKLRTELVDGIEATVRTELPKVIASLTAIQKSVEGQGESPIERILEQLRDAVSGGMQSESSKMSQAIQEFAEVIPDLARQLKQTTQEMTSEMRSRAEDSSRTNQALMSQVNALLANMAAQQAASEKLVTDIGLATEKSAGAMLDRVQADMAARATTSAQANDALVGQVGALLQKMEAQQGATEKLIGQIGEASAKSTEDLMKRVQKESDELFAGLLRTSREDVDALLGKLREATLANEGSYKTIEASVGAASRAILEARDGLASSASSIQELTTQSQAFMTESRTTHEMARSASNAFARAVSELKGGVDAMGSAVENARIHTTEEGRLLELHRKQLKELEELWPKLFTTYVQGFNEKSNQILAKWQEFYRSSESFSTAAGAPLTEAANELTAAVEKLAKIAARPAPPPVPNGARSA